MPDFDNEFTEKEYIDSCNEAHKSERGLATIRVVEELKPIEGADKIEAARVGGWWVVVKKGEFQVSDLAVYFEIDSFLPQRPEFEFLRKNSLRKNWDGSEGFRLKTIKLRGQLSQGLLLPILSLYSDIVTTDDGRTLDIGMDVTERLGVTKWEKPLHKSLAGVARSNFPSFIPKTDESRIQNLGRDMDKMRECEGWYAREKLDGSSMTIYLKDGVFGVCSRNLDLKETDDNAFWEFARRAGLETRLRESSVENIAVQGELIGPGIQGNKYGLKQTQMFVFGVYDITNQLYVHDSDMENMAEFLHLDCAPIVSIFQQLPDRDDILSQANGVSALADTPREGCVWRHYAEGDGWPMKYSFKAIDNIYLLKEKD
jgi:RNA ligase (TIGR02306 family)